MVEFVDDEVHNTQYEWSQERMWHIINIYLIALTTSSIGQIF
jgi:hypothetical protein